MPYEFDEILDTIRMTEIEHFDIRTVTLGISLRDCFDSNLETAKKNVYDKILKYGRQHVEYADEVESKFGVSIANKRIAVTPVSIPFDRLKADEFTEIAKTLDDAAEAIGIDFLGGYSALVQKGFTNGDKELIKSIPRTLAETKHICSSINVASTKAGINVDAVNMMSEIIKSTAELTKDQGSVGCAKLVVYCNVPEDNPGCCS
jgi:uncharacterized protein (UPF0210 family)